MKKPKAAFFCNRPDLADRVFPESRIARLKELADVHPVMIDKKNFEEQLPALTDCEYIFSTWGMLILKAEQIQKLPSLKMVLYGAGTVKYFAEPFLQQDIRIVSAWAANAVPVAEFTVAQMTLAAKGYFGLSRKLMVEGAAAWKPTKATGNYDIEVSILGAGMVGREVVQRLSYHDINILVFDPYLSAPQAENLGVTLVGLDEAFARGYVVSNHLANVPETENMLKSSHFSSMPVGSTFINTGRGATVDEPAMIEILSQRADITALLDVAQQEPLAADSPLYQLPNVWLSPHIAGSMGREVVRMADFVLDEFERTLNGEALRFEVTLEQLPTMA
jgi:phosphoglycerate dehydrogenase-like enzyme